MVDRKKWEELIRESEQRIRAREMQERRLFRRYVTALRQLITVELLIGLIAVFSMYMQFGWRELERTLLSWTIGITVAATLVTFMINKYKKITHVN